MPSLCHREMKADGEFFSRHDAIDVGEHLGLHELFPLMDLRETGEQRLKQPVCSQRS